MSPELSNQKTAATLPSTTVNKFKKVENCVVMLKQKYYVECNEAYQKNYYKNVDLKE